MKKALLFLLSAIIVASCLMIPAFADSASISASSTDVIVGNNVTVNLNYSSNLGLYTTTGKLTYNTAVLEYVSGGASVSGSTVSLYKDLNGENTVSFPIVFKTIAEGSSSLNFHIEGSDGNTKGTADSSALITVSTPAPSDNANLSSLTVVGAGISPAFSPDITTYSASVPNDIESVLIQANTVDGGASYIGAGDKSLNEGDNSFVITVTAPSGAKKTYTINIRRRLKDELTLEEILTVKVGKDTKKIVEDISNLPILSGFKVSTTKYKTYDIGVLVDKSKKYKLFYLTDEDGNNPKLYTLNSSGDFETIPAIEFGGKHYFVEDPENYQNLPQGYIEKTFKIANKKFVSFGFDNKKMDDFYILYCFNGKTREFYTYDTEESVLQRFPMFVLNDTKPVDKAENKDISIADTFLELPLIFKIAIGLAPILLIVVIILIIVMIVLKNKRLYDDYPLDISEDEQINFDKFQIDLGQDFDD